MHEARGPRWIQDTNGRLRKIVAQQANEVMKLQKEVCADLAGARVVEVPGSLYGMPTRMNAKVANYNEPGVYTALRHSLVIVLVAAILCLPFLLFGVPLGYDSITHTMYQYHFSRQFWGGDFYPRWLSEANKGYGSPIFLVQYPLPYFITALLRPILSFSPAATRESHELAVYCFLMLVAAGLSARIWFRDRCTPIGSTVAAIAYISLPYTIGQVLYARVAIGELAAFVWMPLMFAFCDRVHRKRFAMMCAIGAAFALLVLSNILYAFVFLPVFVLYAAVSGKRTVLPVLFALALGICFAAAYLFPLIAYQRFFDPSAFITHHQFGELGRNLLYISSGEVHDYRIAIPGILCVACLTLFVARYIWHGRGGFAVRLSMLLTLGLGAVLLIPGMGPALLELSRLKVTSFESFAAYSMFILFTALLILGLALLSYCRVSGEQSDPRERVLLAVSCGAFVLMLPWSAEIWRAVPRVEIFQYPWRLCAILAVAGARLFAAAVDDGLRHGVRGEGRPSLAVMILVALAVIGAGNIIWRVDSRLRAPSTPRVDVTQWVDPMYVTYVPALKLAAFAKSVGTSPDSFEVAPTPVEEGVHAKFVAGKGIVSVTRVGPRKLLVSARCLGDARVQIGQLYFPLWKIVPMTQHPLDEALGSSAEGLIELSLAPGQHDFELAFDGGWPERSGAIVTVVSVLLAVGGFGFAGLRGRLRKPSLSRVSSLPRTGIGKTSKRLVAAARVGEES